MWSQWGLDVDVASAWFNQYNYRTMRPNKGPIWLIWVVVASPITSITPHFHTDLDHDNNYYNVIRCNCILSLRNEQIISSPFGEASRRTLPMTQSVLGHFLRVKTDGWRKPQNCRVVWVKWLKMAAGYSACKVCGVRVACRTYKRRHTCLLYRVWRLCPLSNSIHVFVTVMYKKSP